MKPTLTPNDELLLPNGKLYKYIDVGWDIENTDTSINKS